MLTIKIFGDKEGDEFTWSIVAADSRRTCLVADGVDGSEVGARTRMRAALESLVENLEFRAAVEASDLERLHIALERGSPAAPQESSASIRGASPNRGMDTDAQVFFYEREFYCLSNFSAFSLLWDEARFDTSEAAYQAAKFPAHPEIQLAIRIAPSAHEAFRVARQHDDRRRPDWIDVRVDVMRLILRAKIAQHPYVLQKLLQTGERELVEDSWRDSFWGWGEDRAGRNMLGKLWMELREQVRR